ncbi:MAG: pilus assembly protein [Elusimicrobia bacterium]|nr:pilus assembly protein [Candidatus Liberimonas magnetica]
MKTYNKGTLKSIKGQALIENVLLLPVLIVIIFMITFFSRLVLTKQQLTVAARLGSDLIAYTEMDEEGIKNEIIDYLCGKDVLGRKLDKDKLKIKVNIDRFPKLDISNVNKLFEILDNFYNPCDHTSSVEIQYEFYTPKIFSAWDTYIPGKKLADKICVSARSEVLAGTGA